VSSQDQAANLVPSIVTFTAVDPPTAFEPFSFPCTGLTNCSTPVDVPLNWTALDPYISSYFVIMVNATDLNVTIGGETLGYILVPYSSNTSRTPRSLRCSLSLSLSRVNAKSVRSQRSCFFGFCWVSPGSW
jgi:hypothetical protein